MPVFRRHDLAPRVELLPLIDVIFLLLTFFIYSLIVMVRAEVLPVRLQAVGTAEAAQPGHIHAITIDRRGVIHLNREPMTAEQLDVALARIADEAEPGRLFIAMEEVTLRARPEPEPMPGPGNDIEVPSATVDRGPLLLDLVERVRRAGIEDFAFVGPPAHR